MKINKQTLIIAILIATVIFLGLQIIKSNKIIKQQDQNQMILLQGYKFELSKKDSQSVYQQQVIVDKNSKIADLVDSLKEIKNIQSQVHIVTKTIYNTDTVKIPREFHYQIDTTSYLALPFSFEKDLKWAKYKFTLTQDFDIIRDSLYFINDFIVVMGYQKKFNINPFDKNKPIVYFRDKNPYTKTTQMQNVVIEDFKPRRISIGIQAGYGISGQGLGPYIGVGVNYSLLNF